MKMEDYYILFPDEKVWCAERSTTQIHGMLEFNETASSWAAPFNGNWAYYSIKDGRKINPNRELPTLAEAKRKAKYSRYAFPSRFMLTEKSVMDDHKLETLQSQMTKSEITYREKYLEEAASDWYTIEKPFCLYMCGNDDCSYSKFFATLEQAMEELTMLEACQPLDMNKDIQHNGFVFTN